MVSMGLFELPGPATQPIDEVLLAHRLLRPVDSIYDLSTTDNSTLTAWLHLTNACNLRCTYCYVKSTDRMSLETGMHAVEAVFRSARAGGFKKVVLKYAGGEPTLNFGVMIELHSHAARLANASKIKLDEVILNNGVAWTSEMVNVVKQNGLRVMVSLDGLGALHDQQRPTANGRPSFQRVEQSLKTGGRECKIVVSATITNQTWTDCPTWWNTCCITNTLQPEFSSRMIVQPVMTICSFGQSKQLPACNRHWL
jgi:uncharacterized protein